MDIASVPSSFDFVGTTMYVTFAIPSGTYSVASWYCAGVASWDYQERLATGAGYANAVQFALHRGAWAQSISGAANLSDINAAAGGTLTVQIDTVIAVPYPSQDAISSLILTLTMSAGPSTPYGGGPVHALSDVQAPPAGGTVRALPDATWVPSGRPVQAQVDVPILPLGRTVQAAHNVAATPLGRPVQALATAIPNPVGRPVPALPDTVGPAHAVPVLVRIRPTSVLEGGAAFVLTLIGEGFASVSVAQWDGTDLVTTYDTENRLRATVPASLLLVAGVAYVTVYTPEPGGGTSNALPCTIVSTTPPAPPSPPPAVAITAMRARPGWVAHYVRGLLAMSQGRQSAEIMYATDLLPGVVGWTERPLTDLVLPASAPELPIVDAWPPMAGWTVVCPTESDPASTEWHTLDDWLNTNRPLGWLFGGGLMFDPLNGWRLGVDIEAYTAPALLDAQVPVIEVHAYADCGDVFGLVSAARSYTDPFTIACAIVLRGGAHGLVLDESTGLPMSGAAVSVSDETMVVPSGAATSGAQGEWTSGEPYCRGEHLMRASAAGSDATATAHNRARHRYVLRGGVPEESPSCLHDALGQYRRVYVKGGAVYFRESPVSTPSVLSAAVAVTAGTVDKRPTIGVNEHGRAFVLFERAGDAYLCYSDDDGQTWSTPTVAIAGGTHPINRFGIDGSHVVAAYVGGNIQATVQHPGDPTASPATTIVNDLGAALSVEDDSFGIDQGHAGDASWILSVRILGEGTVSEWHSTDAITWTRVV